MILYFCTMRKFVKQSITQIEEFTRNLVALSTRYNQAVILNSNGYTEGKDWFNEYKGFELLAAIDSVGEVTTALNEPNSNKQSDWQFGYINYDAKNHIEPSLTSKNSDRIGFDEVCFFTPRFVIEIASNTVKVSYLPDYNNHLDADKLIEEINNFTPQNDIDTHAFNISHTLQKEEYVDRVNKIKEHIFRGDIYELNFCMEFYANKANINPSNTYNKLISLSPTPFAAFVKSGEHYLLSASPERYIKRVGNRVISQPIKGTARRGNSADNDNCLKADLINDPKEQSENIMITDLVRNDLSKVAKRGSVKVEELMGLYTFPQVHQLISTISADVSSKTTWLDIVKATFPMGSMTGAPKINAMQLIDKYEVSKRGLYSGAVGYIAPNGDFDFNVVIRSLLYNNNTKCISFSVGSAITANSNAEAEYNECLLKASALLKALNASL